MLGKNASLTGSHRAGASNAAMTSQQAMTDLIDHTHLLDL